MSRTSIKNQLILSFLALLLIVMVVVAGAQQITDNVMTSLAISAALALAAGIVFGGIFSRSIVRRLNSLSSIAKEISRGDLSKEIVFLSQDEIRDLEEVFAAMVKDLREILSEIKTVSTQVEETGRTLGVRVAKVLSSSKEIDESATAIAKGSEAQSLIVQKTSLVLDKTLEEMDEAARQSEQTVSKTTDALKKTDSGEARARETLSYLEEVLKQMSENAEPIYRLSGKVEKIRMVMSVIEELSQKTDLLSLNASKAVTAALRKSEEDINKGRRVIRGIVGTFAEMLSGVKEIAGEVAVVGDSIRKQTREMRGLLYHFQELSRLAQENFVSTQTTTIGTNNQKEEVMEIVREANSLNALAQKMMETQRRFRLQRV